MSFRQWRHWHLFPLSWFYSLSSFFSHLIRSRVSSALLHRKLLPCWNTTFCDLSPCHSSLLSYFNCFQKSWKMIETSALQFHIICLPTTYLSYLQMVNPFASLLDLFFPNNCTTPVTRISLWPPCNIPILLMSVEWVHRRQGVSCRRQGQLITEQQEALQRWEWVTIKGATVEEPHSWGWEWTIARGRCEDLYVYGSFVLFLQVSGADSFLEGSFPGQVINRPI